jgi:hypothetical protein
MTEPLYKEIWSGFRPYLLVFSIDLLAAGSLWGLLALFRLITKLVPLKEKAAEVIATIHSVGVVVVFGVLAGALVVDVVQIKRGKHHFQGSSS